MSNRIKVILILFMGLTCFLWEEFRDLFIATTKLTVGSVALSSLVALSIVSLQTTMKLWLQKLLGLWMALPSLLVAFFLLQAFEFFEANDSETALLIIAFGQLPFMIQALWEAKVSYSPLVPLTRLGRLSFFQKAHVLYKPFLLPALKKHIGFQASYGLWAFSVPLLLCTANNRPLAPTLFYLFFEEQAYSQGCLLLCWGILGITLLHKASTPSTFAFTFTVRKVTYAQGFSWGSLIALGFLAYPFIYQIIKIFVQPHSLDFSGILWPALISTLIALIASLLTLTVSMGSILRFPRIAFIMSYLPLALPNLFWALSLGVLSIHYCFPKMIIMTMYFFTIAFLGQPYILSILKPLTQRFHTEIGPLLKVSRLTGWQSFFHVYVPYAKTALYSCFIYSFAWALGDVMVFFCLSPFETSSLAVELYESLQRFDWARARTITLFMTVSFMIMALKKNYSPKLINKDP